MSNASTATSTFICQANTTRSGFVRSLSILSSKPPVNIREDISPAYQLCRHAWSAKLPLSILTDFEEFAVYDSRIKPGRTDKASTARIFYLTYTDYISRWDEIAPIFSRYAILKGSFGRYVESSKVKRGTAGADTALLEEIDRWREVPVRNIALRNPGLKKRELNFIVQRTIDRIVFLRICEDRGIEPYGRLMSLRNGTQTYRDSARYFSRPMIVITPAFFTSERKGIAHLPPMISHLISQLTTKPSRIFSEIFITRTARMNFPSFRQIFSGRFMNGFGKGNSSYLR